MKANDRRMTPPGLALAALKMVHDLGYSPKRVIDAGAGNGAWAGAACHAWPSAEVHAVEANPITKRQMSMVDWHYEDWFSWARENCSPGAQCEAPTLIVGNPPWSTEELPKWIEQIELMIRSGAAFGAVQLLPALFYCTQRRAEIIERFPPAIVAPVTPRPRFGDGVNPGGGSPRAEAVVAVWLSFVERTRWARLHCTDKGGWG